MPAADSRLEVSVVMPCLNEAATVGACVANAREALGRLGVSGEVVVADNGSTDGSADRAVEAGARVVRVEARGYGFAYHAGIAAARGAIVVIGDSDGTYDFSQLGDLVRALRAGADLVLGSRLGGTIAPGAMPWLHRYVGNPVLSGLLNRLFGTRIRDTHSGFRAFTRETYDRLDLRTGGMEFASEMLIAASRARLRIVEVPIAYHPREGESKLRSFRDGWRHLKLLLIYSPRHLFVWPGVVMAGLGLALLAWLAPGPVTVFGRLIGYHFMFVGSLLAILGTQVASLGLFALAVKSPPRWFTLERGLAAGAVPFLVGLTINLVIAVRWISSGFGPLDAVRGAIAALTLMAVGAQVFFSAFYLDLLAAGAAGVAAPHAPRVGVEGEAAAPDAAASRPPAAPADATTGGTGRGTTAP